MLCCMLLYCVNLIAFFFFFFFFQAEDGIRDGTVTGVQTCALPISGPSSDSPMGGLPGRTKRQDSSPPPPPGALPTQRRTVPSGATVSTGTPPRRTSTGSMSALCRKAMLDPTYPARRAAHPPTSRTVTAPATHHPKAPEARRISPDRRTCRSSVWAPTKRVDPEARPASSAASTSAALWKRSSGFFARHRTITVESQRGIFASTSLATGTGSARCFPTISALESPL